RKIGTLREAGAIAAWMSRIVRHECLRRLRAARSRGGTPLEVEQGTEAEPQTATAEDVVLRHLEIEQVAAAISALPADQRVVLVMRDIQGLSGHEVARRLRISTAAMKSRLHRARAGVREALHDD